MTDRPKLLEKEFQKLLAYCFNPQAIAGHPQQKKDLRRFFMAGAKAFSETLLVNADAGDEVTDSDMALMEALQEELKNFGEDVAAGRA